MASALGAKKEGAVFDRSAHEEEVASLLSSMKERLSRALDEIDARTIAEMKTVSEAMLADYAGIQDQFQDRLLVVVDGLDGFCAGVDKLTEAAKEFDQQASLLVDLTVGQSPEGSRKAKRRDYL